MSNGVIKIIINIGTATKYFQNFNLKNNNNS